MDKEKFVAQKTFAPQGENWPQGGLPYESVIVSGMGGSALAARLMFFLEPIFPLWLHNDYGVPEKVSPNTIFVAISYSGNTQEVLSFAQQTVEGGQPLTIITSGGKLLEMARKHNLPYIMIPSGLQPRAAALYMLRALLYVFGKKELLEEMDNTSLEFEKWQEDGGKIGLDFMEGIPLIYSSRRNQALAYVWKIMFNETGKLPAFFNIFPELAHNEIESLFSKEASNMKILFMLDDEDDVRVRHSMNTFSNLASTKNIKANKLNLPHGRMSKLLFTLVTAGSAASTIAEKKGVEAEETSFIKLFKESL
jgi:glucose/mannose-6-phosphate isomerase